MVNTDATACVQVQTCKQTPWREGGASARNFREAGLDGNTADEAEAAAEARADFADDLRTFLPAHKESGVKNEQMSSDALR